MKKLLITTALLNALALPVAHSMDLGFISKSGMSGFEAKVSFVKAHVMTNFGDASVTNGVYSDKSTSEVGLGIEPTFDLDKDGVLQILPFIGVNVNSEDIHSSILNESACSFTDSNGNLDTTKCHNVSSSSQTSLSTGLAIKTNMKITNQVKAYFKFGATSEGSISNSKDYRYVPQASIGLSIEF